MLSVLGIRESHYGHVFSIFQFSCYENWYAIINIRITQQNTPHAVRFKGYFNKKKEAWGEILVRSVHAACQHVLNNQCHECPNVYFA